MLDKVQSADFKQYKGQTFKLHTESGTVIDMELTDVKRLGDPHPEGKRDRFSLIFRHQASQHLPQKIYKVEHDQMGQLEIFLVPLVPDEEGAYMQAVFN